MSFFGLLEAPAAMVTSLLMPKSQKNSDDSRSWTDTFFLIKDQQVEVKNGKISEYRVMLKVTFILDD